MAIHESSILLRASGSRHKKFKTILGGKVVR